MQTHAGSAALTLIETRLSLCIPSCIRRSWVIYINFWPGGLLAFYGPFGGSDGKASVYDV